MLDSSSKVLNQTTGKVRTPLEENDESNSQSNGEEADDGQSIFPEFWLGFNSYSEQEPTDKDLSKSDSDDRNDRCQEKDNSSLLEPNIVFYQQPCGLGKVLDDLSPTDDSGSSSRIMPSVGLSKVDYDLREEVILDAKIKPVPAKIFKSPKQRTLLGKRQRNELEDELTKLFDESSELKGLSKNLSHMGLNSRQNSFGKDHPLKSQSDGHLSFSFRPKRRVAKIQEKEEDLHIQSEKPSCDIKVHLPATATK